MWIRGLSIGNLFISNGLTVKMDGFTGLTTLPYVNPFCIACSKNKKAVCSSCYSIAQLAWKKGPKEAYATNFETLNAGLLNDKDLIKLEDVIMTKYARIETHGEVASVTQARNYIRIINVNKETFFGIWSKRPEIWKEAFELEGGKPANCSFVLSSIELNNVREVEEQYKGIVDTVFTVFDKEYIAEHDVKVNCGETQCKKCLRCYKKHDSVQYVCEQQK